MSSEVSSWLSVCCRRLRDVVDVVGDPAEQLAARLAVEVAQRQPVQLVLDLGAQPVDGALHDAVEQVALQPAKHATPRRRAPSDQQQHVAERGEVDALARARRPSPASMSARLSLPWRAQRRRRPAAWVMPGGQLPADDAGEDDVGRVAEDLRADARDSATLTTREQRRRRRAASRSGAAGRSSRLADGPKFIDFSAGMPDAHPTAARRGAAPAARRRLGGRLRRAVSRRRSCRRLRRSAGTRRSRRRSGRSSSSSSCVPLPDDAAVLEHDDLVGVDDGRHPLGDDDHRRVAR